MNSKRKENISHEQKREMLEFLDKHPDLQKGKFTKDFTFKKSQELWITLANQLNAMPRAQKEWKLWRKTWQDLKGSAKKKQSDINIYRRTTGGGPTFHTSTTEEDNMILAMIGTSATEGHPDILESETSFQDLTNVLEVDMVKEAQNDNNDFYILKEHCYNINNIEVSSVQNEQNIKENKIESSGDPNQNIECDKIEGSKQKRKKTMRVERLNHTIAATEKFAEQTDLITKQTGEYQRNKLFEKDIDAKKRIASALEQIAKNLADLKKQS